MRYTFAQKATGLDPLSLAFGTFLRGKAPQSITFNQLNILRGRGEI